MPFGTYIKCEICGNFFNKVGRKNICSSCREDEDKLFIIVRDYLYEYPKAPIGEVSEQTDVPEDLIAEWVREGRLESKGITLTYPCGMCGKPIHEGKICKKCTDSLGSVSKDLKDQLDSGEKKRTMYISEKK